MRFPIAFAAAAFLLLGSPRLTRAWTAPPGEDATAPVTPPAPPVVLTPPTPPAPLTTPPAPPPTPPEVAEAPMEVTLLAARSLIFDVRKIVEIQASGGWKIDRYEYEKMMPDTLLSVCRTTEQAHRLALTDAAQEVGRLGGPLADALKKNGNKIDDLKELLFATRVEQTLAEALRRAPGECSIWMTPKTDFRSLQTGVDRFTLTIEGGGTALLQIKGGHSGVAFFLSRI